MKNGIKGIAAIACALFIAGVAHQAHAITFTNFSPVGTYSTCTDTVGGNQVVGHACVGNDPEFCDIGTKQVAAFCNGNFCGGEFVQGAGCPTQNWDDATCITTPLTTGATVTSTTSAPQRLFWSACVTEQNL